MLVQAGFGECVRRGDRSSRGPRRRGSSARTSTGAVLSGADLLGSEPRRRGSRRRGTSTARFSPVRDPPRREPRRRESLGANLGGETSGAKLLGANLRRGSPRRESPGADLLGANLLGANLYLADLLRLSRPRPTTHSRMAARPSPGYLGGTHDHHQTPQPDVEERLVLVPPESCTPYSTTASRPVHSIRLPEGPATPHLLTWSARGAGAARAGCPGTLDAPARRPAGTWTARAEKRSSIAAEWAAEVDAPSAEALAELADAALGARHPRRAPPTQRRRRRTAGRPGPAGPPERGAQSPRSSRSGGGTSTSVCDAKAVARIEAAFCKFVALGVAPRAGEGSISAPTSVHGLLARTPSGGRPRVGQGLPPDAAARRRPRDGWRSWWRSQEGNGRDAAPESSR